MIIRFAWIFPLKTKSETQLIFKQFHKLAEKQFNTSLKCVQTDWEGEYRSLVSYFSDHGIIF